MNDLPQARIRSAWNVAALLRGKKLTDKQIAKYEKLGYYSAEFRRERRAAWERARKRRREGSFDVSEDGRMIYNPR